MNGKLIVIEGLDSSGKETQTKLLIEKLTQMGLNTKRYEFPNYGSPSSTLVKMYLGGEFGTNADDVSPYAASTFYAADRYATWKKDMQQFYENGGIIIADRYTTSNIIHQAGKIKDSAKQKEYIDWLYDFEFVKMGLPKPDTVIFLHMPVEVSVALMKNRANKAGTQSKDIHERNIEYLKSTYQNAVKMIDLCGFERVECCDGENLRTKEDIHNEIMQKIAYLI